MPKPAARSRTVPRVVVLTSVDCAQPFYSKRKKSGALSRTVNVRASYRVPSPGVSPIWATAMTFSPNRFRAKAYPTAMGALPPSMPAEKNRL